MRISRIELPFKENRENGEKDIWEELKADQFPK
jgi:hypothetical protein